LWDEYDCPEKRVYISARECQRRLALHALFPAFISLLFCYFHAPVLARAVWVLFWGVYTIMVERKESAWQKPLKTRSDIISKLIGLIVIGLP
jgi:hypothetical protein